jgi:hypothetical protein
MPTIDSRSATPDTEKYQYVNSNPYVDTWGQPPASYFQIEVINGIIEGQLIKGTYISTSSLDEVASEDDQKLNSEILLWEALGIEDWMNFESSLGE